MQFRFRLQQTRHRCRFWGGRQALKGIISYIVFFSIGLLCAGLYFYRLHPEHSPDADIPRLRKDVDDAMDRGRRLREAWDRPESAEEASTQD